MCFFYTIQENGDDARPSKPKVRPNKALERLLKEVGCVEIQPPIRRRVVVAGGGLCRLSQKINNQETGNNG
jgi:hypothetical protein